MRVRRCVWFQSPLYRVSESFWKVKTTGTLLFQSPLYRVSESLYPATRTCPATRFQSPLYRVSESLRRQADNERHEDVSIPSLSGLRVITEETEIVLRRQVSIPSLSGLRVIQSRAAIDLGGDVSIPSLSGLRVIQADVDTLAVFCFNPLFIGSPSHCRIKRLRLRIGRFNPLFIGSPSHYPVQRRMSWICNVSIPSLSGLRVIIY